MERVAQYATKCQTPHWNPIISSPLVPVVRWIWYSVTASHQKRGMKSVARSGPSKVFTYATPIYVGHAHLNLQIGYMTPSAPLIMDTDLTADPVNSNPQEQNSPIYRPPYIFKLTDPGLVCTDPPPTYV